MTVRSVYLTGGAGFQDCAGAFERSVSCSSAQGQLLQPGVRISGHGSPWSVTAGGLLHRDALFSVAEGAAGEAALVELGLPRQLLARVEAPLQDVLDDLSLFTASVLALSDLTTAATERPASTGADIERCRRWLRRPVLQYMTGRGALRSVVSPWERFVEEYEHRLMALQRAWQAEVLPCLAALPASSPLRPLLEPLRLAAVERDTVEIQQEYRVRLAALNRECGRVAGEIGVVGTLASLALVPAAEPLGVLFLAPVALAAAAYFGGHAVAQGPARLTRRLRLRRIERQQRSARMGAVAEGLHALLPRLRSQPVHILTSSKMSVGDVAASIGLWLNVLQTTDQADPLAAVQLSDADTDRAALRVVVGGPLVRTGHAAAGVTTRPVCDLVRTADLGWHVRDDRAVLAFASEEEQLGCVSADAEGQVLFLFGTRDAGTVQAARWLAQHLNGAHPPRSDYALIGPGHRAPTRSCRPDCP